MNDGLIRYRKLTIILVSIGEGESDDVIPGLVEIKPEAIGRYRLEAEDHRARNLVQFHRHCADVLREGHHKVMTINGGLDGVAFWDACDMSFFYLNGTIPIY